MLICLCVVAFLSDVLFVYALETDGDKRLLQLRTAALVFIIIPLFINAAVSIYFVHLLHESNPAFLDWVKEHQFPASLMLVLGALNVELITTAESRLFHLKMFSEVIVQSLTLIYGMPSLVTVVSIALSSLALVQGIMGRSSAFLLSKTVGEAPRTRGRELLPVCLATNISIVYGVVSANR